MPNHIPLLEGTDSHGGYLVPDEVRETLVSKIQRESALLQLVEPTRVVGKRAKYPVYAGRPTVTTTAEGAPKAVTGAEYAELVINIVKFTATVLYTEELLEDAREDPTVLVNQDLEAAFSQAIEAHALGFAAGSAITSDFDAELGASSQSVELGTGGDALAKAVSGAMTLVEEEGGNVNGIILTSDLRGHIRDARQTVETASPVYQNFTDAGSLSSLYGAQVGFSSNLDALPAGAGKVAAVVGDFSAAKLALRSDLTVRTSTEATVVDGGNTHNLFQENKVAALWEMRVGFNALDVNRNFAIVANAS